MEAEFGETQVLICWVVDLTWQPRNMPCLIGLKIATSEEERFLLENCPVTTYVPTLLPIRNVFVFIRRFQCRNPNLFVFKEDDWCYRLHAKCPCDHGKWLEPDSNGYASCRPSPSPSP